LNHLNFDTLQGNVAAHKTRKAITTPHPAVSSQASAAALIKPGKTASQRWLVPVAGLAEQHQHSFEASDPNIFQRVIMYVYWIFYTQYTRDIYMYVYWIFYTLDIILICSSLECFTQRCSSTAWYFTLKWTKMNWVSKYASHANTNKLNILSE
jgi:hypothetical protein